MDRAAYNQCMSPHITGSGKSKEERQLGFCVGAKLCSGKAENEEEAIRICSEPKEPKPVKAEKTEKKEKRHRKATREVTTLSCDLFKPESIELLSKSIQVAEVHEKIEHIQAEKLQDIMSKLSESCGVM